MFRLVTEAFQMLRVAPGEKVRWAFGTGNGESQADATRCITIPGLKITAEPVTLASGNK